VAWLQHQEAARRKQEEAQERERVSYAQVDWHNFVVVETVDYQPWEVGNFPPPTNPGEVGARVLIQRRQEEQGGPPPPVHQDSDSDEDEGADTNVQDMEEDSESDSDEEQAAALAASKSIKAPVMAAPPVQQPAAPPVPPIQAVTPGNVTIKKYDPKAAAAVKKKVDDDQFLISPITGEKIPASKAAEHMKVGLLDPRWVEERDKHITAKANEEVVFAPGQSIESSLKQLAERRTDIFGVGEEAAQETAIGQKMGDEDNKPAGEKVTWDGHSSSAEAAARAARANISLNDQIAQIHKQKGLLADQADAIGVQQAKTVVVAPPQPAPPVQTQPPIPPATLVPQPMMVGVPVRPAMMVPAPVFVPARPMAPPQMFMSAPPAGPIGGPGGPPQQAPMIIDDDEPAAKRSKTEENLMPEAEFMARFGSPVTFKVLVPAMPDKPEWKLEGQMLSLTMELTDTVTSIKSRIHEELGMPPGKQKLQQETLFLKDAMSLAYYNVMPGTMMALQLKERGGRKK
jgi:splicing factor 3A subunit 1